MTDALGNVNVAPGYSSVDPTTNKELLASSIGWTQDGVQLAVGNGTLAVGTPLSRFDDGTFGPTGGGDTPDRVIGEVTGATDGTFTAASDHGLAAGDAVEFSDIAGGLTGVTAGTKYYVIATGLTATVFEVSATAGGSAVTISAGGTATATEVTASESANISGFLRRETDTGVAGDLPKYGNCVYRGTLKYDLIKAANGGNDLTSDQLTQLNARVDADRGFLIF